MAFDNVTFFELHLDGAQFGPSEVPGASEDREPEREYEHETGANERGGGRGRVLALVVLSIGLSAAAAAIANRFRGDAEQIEVEAIGESVESAAER